MDSRMLASASMGVSIFLSGCASPLDKPGGLVSEWSDRFRQFQIFPIFPPREDLQVGDIYITCALPDPEKANEAAAVRKPVPVSQLIATTPGVNNALNKYYKDRVFLPEAATAKEAAQTASGDGTLAKIPRREMYGSSAETNRLRNVSLPELFSVTVSGIDAAALLPTGIVLGGLDVSAQDIQSMTISIPSSGSYGLPGNVIEGLLASVEIPYARSLLNAYTAVACDGRQAQYVVVSEVYAAYAINVRMNFTSQGAAKAQAALKLPDDSARKSVFDALARHFGSGSGSDKSDGTSKDSGAKSGADPAPKAGEPKQAGKAAEQSGANGAAKATPAQLEADLKALIADLEGRKSLEFPGVKVNAYSGSSAGITLERAFANPVVVGYRGYAVDFGDDMPPTSTAPLPSNMSGLSVLVAQSGSGGTGSVPAPEPAQKKPKPRIGPPVPSGPLRVDPKVESSQGWNDTTKSVVREAMKDPAARRDMERMLQDSSPGVR